MKESSRIVWIGSLAAFLQVLGYVAFSVAAGLLVLTQGYSFEDFIHPELILAKAAKHSAALPLLGVMDGGYLAHAVLSFVVIVALVQLVSETSLSHKLLIVGPAVMNSALFLAGAAADLSGLQVFVPIYLAHADQAVEGYRVLFTIIFQMEGAAAGAYGISIMILSWVTWQRQVFPKGVSALGVCWGAVALLSWPFPVVAALALIGLLWYGWLGVLLLRLAQRHRQREAEEVPVSSA